MHLSNLTLFGFKSFVDRVSIDFQPGVTSLVGPNGCGKSNIIDAMLWVLGEQSPKALRGERMEDLIFAGNERLETEEGQVAEVHGPPKRSEVRCPKSASLSRLSPSSLGHGTSGRSREIFGRVTQAFLGVKGNSTKSRGHSWMDRKIWGFSLK